MEKQTSLPQPVQVQEEYAQTSHDTIASKIPISRFMTTFAIVIAMSGWMAGFDTGYSGTILQMRPFNQAFGHCRLSPGPGGKDVEVCRLSATQQSVTFISGLFTALGCALSGPSCHHLGRKRTLQLGCLIVCIGAAGLLGTSSNYTSFMVCKCIAAVGIGPFQIAGPMYGMEGTAPHRRGALFALFGIGIAFGSMVIASVCLGSNNLHNNWSWKTPIACQIPISVIYIFIISFFPESPRWLLMRGRVDDARAAFARFYGADPQSELVSAQIDDTQSSITLEADMRRTTSWTELFKPNYIRRTSISVGVMCGSALSGIWFISPYAAVFFADVGLKNPFYSNLAFQSCVLAGGIICPFVLEVLGRRAGLLLGYPIMATLMMLVAAVCSGLGTTTPSVQRAVVALLCLWGTTFGATVSANSWLASSEVHSVRLRAYGQGFTGLVGQTTAFACSFWTPYMLSKDYGNMGTNVGYFYCGISVISVVAIFIFLPETARLSLEQIDDVFATKRRPWKTSLARNRRIARGEEHNLSNAERDAKIQEVKQARIAVAG